jgi:hypothetical protein
MNPTPSDVHVNVPLTNISISYLNTFDGVADIVFPNVPVTNQSNTYWKYNRDDWNRIEAQERAPGTESVGSGWRMATDQYYARVYAFHKDLDDQTRGNADNQFNLDASASTFVTRNLQMKKEKLWVDTYFRTGVWGTEYTGVASGTPSGSQFLRWDNASSTPIQDILNWALAMEQATGGWRPNVLVIGPQVFNSLMNHPDFIDRIKYTQRGVLTPELIAALLNVDRVLVPRAIYNTANEGAAETNVFMYGKAMMLAYSNPDPSPLTPSAGYTFSWTGYLGAGAMGNRVSSFRMPAIKSDRIEGEMAFDQKLVASDLGIFLAQAVS